GEFARCTGPGFIGEDRLDGAAEFGVGLGALEVDQALEGTGPASPPDADGSLRQSDGLGDHVVAVSLEGEQDDGGALAEPRGSRDGVAQGPKDLLLTFGDGDLGGLPRHDALLVGGNMA